MLALRLASATEILDCKLQLGRYGGMADHVRALGGHGNAVSCDLFSLAGGVIMGE